jgi:ABC-type nickel/cobalt efflux system permease component RcnA
MPMDLEPLYHPFEALDEWLSAFMVGSPLLLVLFVSFLLGLRHASDPDHLVAVTSLLSTRDGDVRSGVSLGAWWGFGHAATLLAVGTPLILLKTSMPAWLEGLAEKAVGAIILVLAARILWKWVRGDYAARPGPGAGGRTRLGSFAIGVVHGLGGTAAVVLLLIAAVPDPLWAVAMLAVFAPMSIVSMAACTGLYAWALTRPAMASVYRSALVPALGCFGLMFGSWYAGVVP